MESMVGFTGRERMAPRGVHEPAVRGVVEGDSDQQRAEQLQICLRLVCKPGMEGGLEAMSEDIPDITERPAAVSEESWKDSSQGLSFGPLVEPEGGGAAIADDYLREGSEPRELLVNYAVEEASWVTSP